jgi:hypothetical protein
MAEVEAASPVLLVATLPREIRSWKYIANNIDYVLVTDPDWEPTLDPGDGSMLAATGFKAFVELMKELRTDEKYGSIIVDSGTELAEMGWHYSMLPHNVSTPAMIEDQKSRWLPYETLDIHMCDAIKKAVSLTLPETAIRPKNVMFTWHLRPAQEDLPSKGGGTKQSADKISKDVEYGGAVLPAVRGQFRRKLQQYVSFFVYAHKHIGGDPLAVDKEVKYWVQVQSDLERDCKVPGPVPGKKFLETNHWEDLSQFVAHQKELEQKAGDGGSNSLSNLSTNL